MYVDMFLKPVVQTFPSEKVTCQVQAAQIHSHSGREVCWDLQPPLYKINRILGSNLYGTMKSGALARQQQYIYGLCWPG